MLQFFVGIVTIILCIVGYVVGFTWAKKRNYSATASYGHMGIVVVGVVWFVLLWLVGYWH